MMKCNSARNSHLLILFMSVFLSSLCWGVETDSFQSARPVWLKGRAEEMNLFVEFRAPFFVADENSQSSGIPASIRVTASTLYRVLLNGEFIGYGPARGPHGYYRVDEWDLTGKVPPGLNYVSIEVAGYNVNSYYLLDQPSFLQAEILRDSRVVASTGGLGNQFNAYVLSQRLQKVQRYSFQRPFIEAYRLEPLHEAWRKHTGLTVLPSRNSVECEVVEEKKLLPRRVGYPRFDLHPPVRIVSQGDIKTGIEPKELWKDRSLVNINEKFKGYPEDELEIVVSNKLQTITTHTNHEINQPYQWGTKIPFSKNSFSILDFGTNLSGFIRTKVRCEELTRLVITFDEILHENDVNWRRLGCVNAVWYELEKGEYELETYEPYTLRYIKPIVLEGNCTIEELSLRDYVYPDTEAAQFASSNPRLNRLFEAGRQTFAQNGVDVFMDCPSRERAGWLCDSFFTSRVAFDLSRDCRLETNFFENYLLPPRFAHLPDGMLPMCYPADHNDGVFIPNWALWFVIELEEYYQRSGNREMIDALETKVMALLDYFQPFLNEDGLLEKLESWVFVEWSAANQFVQDVNYPSNMLYASVLDVAGRLYGKSALRKQAETIRETIRQQSFDGEFFVDNAMRENGKLNVTKNRSEVCQYFAFFFDVANPQSHPGLWKKLRDEFGPNRKETKAYPEVHFANSFVGNVLRLEILSKYGYCKQILDESIAYLFYMAERTGTLWENDGAYASCNHGFASHIVHVLYRDVLGVRRIDPVQKAIQLRFSELPLDWCEGKIPLPDGEIYLRWRMEKGTLHYCIDIPAGYRLELDHDATIPAVRYY